jgi:ATP-binding cassette subfamily B protein/subfamily B ATP-binding cassette protein MsbA
VHYTGNVVPYLRPYKWLAAATVLTVILVVLASLLSPWPMKVLVDSVLGESPVPAVLDFDFLTEDRFLLMIVVVSSGFFVVLLQNSLHVLREYLTTRLKLRISLDFRGDLFQHAQRLSLAYHDRHYSGKLVYLLNNQAEAVSGLLMTLPLLAQSSLTFIGMFWVLLLIDWQLALAALAVLPLLTYSVGSYARRIQAPLHNVKDLESQTLSMVQEAMSMLRIVVGFGREQYEWRRFREQGKRALNARIDVTVRQTLFDLAVNLITALGLAIVVGIGATHIMEGTLTIGELLVVIAYLSTVYQSLGLISTTIGALQDQLVNLQRAFELLDTRPDVQDSTQAMPLADVSGELAFEKLSFAYGNGNESLHGISFRAHPGEFVAIVGPTGAGKTTLISMIPRFYDPREGRVTIDGMDIRSFTLESLRGQISIVGQEPLLFVGSIADNIRYGKLDATDQEIIDAARAANAHDFIERLPEQYETLVGERGAGFSGGERQRIAVARAFLKNAPVLLLDEPTAFVDVKTESIVLEALRRLRRGLTTIMISHRIATVRDADRILVLEGGRIVEQGRHAELITAGGLYSELNRIQSEQDSREGAA